jgi:hypothetical protein
MAHDDKSERRADPRDQGGVINGCDLNGKARSLADVLTLPIGDVSIPSEQTW